jgi:hypothetical protein
MLTTITSRHLAGTRQRTVLRVAAVLLGVGVPASGFTPFNHAADVLALPEHPWRVLLMPPVLLAALALSAAVVAPRAVPRPPVGLAAGGVALLFLGASLSLLGSDDQARSLLQVVTAVVAPAALFVGVMYSAIPRRVLAISFLGATMVLLARADALFFLERGVPSGTALLQAKFSNQPYDFHYYALQNPNHTAAFVLLPLALAAFWANDRRLSGLCRAALSLIAFTCMLTLVLLFVRSGIVLGVLILLGSVATSRRRLAFGAAGAVVLLVGAVAASPAIANYLVRTGSLVRGSSAQVRLESIATGAAVTAEHPGTGLGLGHFERLQQAVPAHSSIVQAGAEMGLAGMAGVALLSVALCLWSIRLLRQHRGLGMRAGAGVAVTAYVVQAALLGGANAGLANGFVSVWSLSVALLVPVGAAETTPERSQKRGHISIEVAWRKLVSVVRSRTVAERFSAVSIAGMIVAGLAIFIGVAVGALESGGEERRRAQQAERVRTEQILLARRRILQARYRKTNARFYRKNRALESPGLRTPPPPGDVLASWAVPGRASEGWMPDGEARLRFAGGQVQVLTSGLRFGYQLVSPAQTLGVGAFGVAADVKLRSGGMQFAVLDIARNKFIASSLYSARRTRSRRIIVGTRFATRRPTRVRLILANFAGAPLASSWTVDTVTLFRQARPSRRER